MVAHGLRVVGCELRVDRVARRNQFACTGDVRHIGIHLAREYRISREPTLLRALDLAVPVRAFHQPHIEAPAGRLRQRSQKTDHIERPFLIGLHGQAESLPALELRRPGDMFDQLQRQLEALRFFRIDSQRNATIARSDRKLQQSRRQFLMHALCAA